MARNAGAELLPRDDMSRTWVREPSIKSFWMYMDATNSMECSQVPSDPAAQGII